MSDLPEKSIQKEKVKTIEIDPIPIFDDKKDKEWNEPEIVQNDHLHMPHCKKDSKCIETHSKSENQAKFYLNKQK